MKKLRFLTFTFLLVFSLFQRAGAVTYPSRGNGTHICGVADVHPNKRLTDPFPNRRYRTFAAHLNAGEPRTVRLIYFLPNDQPYRAEAVQQMKDDIRTAQTFFAEQMDAHGYGRLTFGVETDAQGEPLVHRFDGQYPSSHYFDDPSIRPSDSPARSSDSPVFIEIEKMFDVFANIYLIIIDSGNNPKHGGVGYKWNKIGGKAWVDGSGNWNLIAHELGHTFGLFHDFREGAYLMSYGPGERDRLSACHAEYLSVHPYFNLDIPIEQGDPPRIELISPHIYPAESKHVPIQFRLNDSDRLHQWLLHAWQPSVRNSVKVCGGLRGTQDTVISFDYDGVISSAHDPFYSRNTSLKNPLVHMILIEAIDVNGNVEGRYFTLFSDALEPLLKLSGDNQRGLPNAPLPVPFVVEVRDLNEGWARRGVPVTFSVTAGGGALNVEQTETDGEGRAESLLTLGPHLGTNTVEVSAEEITVSFTAVAVNPVDIPDPNLRSAVETALGKVQGQLIAPAEMETLSRLKAPNANISDLTGLEHATNLTVLELGPERVANEWRNSNSVSDLSPVTGLTQLRRLHLPNNSITDISPVVSLTNLTWLNLWGNSVPDLAPVEGLTKLTDLWLGDNNISDLSPLVANTGLGSGDTVNVQYNPLSYLSIHTHIPVLQNRGCTVEFDADGTRPPDVSGDGSVDVLDLIVIASYLGNTGADIVADVSGDGVVNVLDIVLVAGSFDGTAAAPPAQAQIPDSLTAVEVQQWLTQAGLLEIRDLLTKRGILVLEQLLVSLTPTETELLANHPNPFNPETWIPYRLAEDAFVTLTIYDLSGRIIRTLDVGHRIASSYESQSKAIYWDGKNELGESVASGIYFYTLTAGNFSATRKMMILK